MNRKNNKRKGFTIVELVIVIAVIGILAGIMIPTFGSVVATANESALDNKAAAIYKEYITNFDYTTGKTPIQNGYVLADDHYYVLTNGNVQVDGDHNGVESFKTVPTETGKTLTKAAESGAGANVFYFVATPAQNG